MFYCIFLNKWIAFIVIGTREHKHVKVAGQKYFCDGFLHVFLKYNRKLEVKMYKCRPILLGPIYTQQYINVTSCCTLHSSLPQWCGW